MDGFLLHRGSSVSIFGKLALYLGSLHRGMASAGSCPITPPPAQPPSMQCYLSTYLPRYLSTQAGMPEQNLTNDKPREAGAYSSCMQLYFEMYLQYDLVGQQGPQDVARASRPMKIGNGFIANVCENGSRCTQYETPAIACMSQTYRKLLTK